MDPQQSDISVLKEYQQVLDPEARLKLITKNSNTVVIDSGIPPRRYYRSGIEMVRMANVYLDEGSLENAFILYMKFMTLFLEKIRTHPDFNTVPPQFKNSISQKLREVLPVAESLKSRLLDQYKREYERFQLDMQRREELAREKRRLLEEKEKASKSKDVTPKPLAPRTQSCEVSKYHISPVPPLLDGLYPNEAEAAAIDKEPTRNTALPSINRSTKPASLLSPTTQNAQSKLRTVVVPGNLMMSFLQIAYKNTQKSIETCAILAGKLRRNQLVITHLLVPKQTGTFDSCTTQKEEDLFDYQDQNELFTFGWIHTHPTQTAFLSSIDLHTHCSYQRMMPEAIAIVCAPKYGENMFFCLTPDYGLDFIANCQQKGFHPHPTEPELFMVAKHCEMDPTTPVEIVDFRT